LKIPKQFLGHLSIKISDHSKNNMLPLRSNWFQGNNLKCERVQMHILGGKL
jgi:hypothetical protein